MSFVSCAVLSAGTVLFNPVYLISIMPLFWKPYTSEISQFLDTLKQKDKQLESKQRQGRALLWDKKLDAQQQNEWQQASVPQQPYVYQTHAETD